MAVHAISFKISTIVMACCADHQASHIPDRCSSGLLRILQDNICHTVSSIYLFINE